MNGKQFEFLRGEWPALFDPAVRTAEWLADGCSLRSSTARLAGNSEAWRRCSDREANV
jgi:hypothetical protein